MPDRQYVFAESPDREESDRLALLAEDCDPGTFRRLERLRPAAGGAFLELGPGTGTVVRWACARFRRVVAVDLDLRFLAKLDEPNLERLSGDIRTLELEPGAFDVVHARCVLLHIGEPVPVLRKLAAAMRPGGRLLIEDLDLSTQRPATEDPEAARIAETVFAAVQDFHVRAGVDMIMGRRLPALFQAAGLAQLGVETELPLVPGGSITARSFAATVRHIAPRLNVSPDDVRRFLGMLEDAGIWMTHAARIGVWGQRETLH